MVKKIIRIVIFFLGISLFSLEIEVQTPHIVGRNIRFEVSFLFDYEQWQATRINPPDLPSEIRYYAGPAIRTFSEQRDGSLVRRTRITYTYVANGYGTFVIPPYEILFGDETAYSEAFILRLGLTNRGELLVPPLPVWEFDREPVYVGEAVPVYLTFKNLEELISYESVNVVPPANASWVEAPGLGRIQRVEQYGIQLYDQPAAGYIMIPQRAGNLTLNGPRVTVGGTDWSSYRGSLRVDPIPIQINLTQAIGVFALDLSVNSVNVSLEDTVLLRLKLSGYGNFPVLKMLEPELTGLQVLNRTVYENFNPSALGYEGSLIYEYELVPLAEGTAEVRFPDFTYMNAQSREIDSIQEQELSIIILAPTAVDSEEVEKEDPLEAVFLFKDASELSKTLSQPHYQNRYLYLLFLPGLLIMAILSVLRQKKLLFFSLCLLCLSAVTEDKFDDLHYAQLLYEEQRFFEAEQVLLDSQLHSYSDLYYNLALTALQQKQVGESTAYIRQAIRMNPSKQLYRQFINFLHERHDVVTTDGLPWLIHPDIFFWMIILLVNIIPLLVFFSLHKPRVSYSILFILSLSFLVAASVFFGMSIFSHNQNYAVVLPCYSEVKRIPQSSSDVWFNIPCGSSLRVLGSSDHYSLVETSLGLKGWILTENLQKDGAYEF